MPAFCHNCAFYVGKYITKTYYHVECSEKAMEDMDLDELDELEDEEEERILLQMR